MGEPVFKDLCIDAVDVQRSARFYAAVLGLTIDPDRADGPVRLVGDRPQQAVWVNAVPEPRTVKNRVHLDVHAGSVTEVLDLGAAVLEEHQRWTTVTDPEGQELCVFVRDDPPAYRLYELVVDAVDPERIARWWCARFGLRPERESGGAWWTAADPALPYRILFDTVPEPRTTKNRVHWDVWGTPEEFCAAGATLLRGPDDAIGWHVLADPEGNEFCVFARD